jgi:hypothetical protein
MITAITIVSMIFIPLALWFLGFWSCALTFTNILLAAMIASNWFEPLADAMDGGSSTYTYILDFAALWLLFFLSFTLLRVATDLLSRMKVEFHPAMDYSMRSVFALASGWVFVCFLQFSFHVAPLPPDVFQQTPETVNFVGQPDRLWLGFLQSRSQGALAASLTEPLSAEYSKEDLHADFIYKYNSRREILAGQTNLRVMR